MSVNNEVYQIDAEHALRDVIDIIFKYLKAKDLSNVTTVCKSWREAALREEGLRCYYQQLRFRYNIQNLGNKYYSLRIASDNPALEKSLSVSEHYYWLNLESIKEEREQIVVFATLCAHAVTVTR